MIWLMSWRSPSTAHLWLHWPSLANDAGGVTVMIYKFQPSLPPATAQTVLGNHVQTTERLANGYASAGVVPPLPSSSFPLQGQPSRLTGKLPLQSFPIMGVSTTCPAARACSPGVHGALACLPRQSTAKLPHNHFQTLKWPHCHYGREIGFVSSKRSVTGDSIGQCQARRQED